MAAVSVSETSGQTSYPIRCNNGDHHLTNNITERFNTYMSFLPHCLGILGDALWHLDGGTEISFPPSSLLLLLPSDPAISFKLRCILNSKYGTSWPNYLCAVYYPLIWTTGGIAKWQRGAGPTAWVINSHRLGDQISHVYQIMSELWHFNP